jgi:hypothetical protein
LSFTRSWSHGSVRNEIDDREILLREVVWRTSLVKAVEQSSADYALELEALDARSPRADNRRQLLIPAKGVTC